MLSAIFVGALAQVPPTETMLLNPPRPVCSAQPTLNEKLIGDVAQRRWWHCATAWLAEFHAAASRLFMRTYAPSP